MNAIDRVKTLCNQRNISLHKLEMDLNFSNGYIASLKKGTMPANRLRQVADYFNVSLSWLESGEEPATETSIDMLELVQALEILRNSPDTRALLEACKSMTPDEIKQMTTYAKFLRSQG